MATGSRLRPWQVQALEAWQRHTRPDFLAVATPGAGKTTFALQAAARAFAAGKVDQLVVVCPSDHLRRQWADAAAAGATWSGGTQVLDVPLHRKVSSARRELHRLVGAVHRRTGAGHGEFHARLRSTCGGPPSAAATLEQLEERIATARGWM